MLLHICRTEFNFYQILKRNNNVNLEMVTSTMSENKDTSQKCLIFVYYFYLDFKVYFLKNEKYLSKKYLKVMSK